VSTQPPKQRQPRSFSLSKETTETITFLTGLLGLGWETVIEKGDKPTLIGAFLAMILGPPARRLDRAAKARRQAKLDTETETE
jgi:hypothetical protein